MFYNEIMICMDHFVLEMFFFSDIKTTKYIDNRPRRK